MVVACYAQRILCCVPMAMPQGHLVVCGDLGIAASSKAQRCFPCCWAVPSSADSSGASWPTDRRSRTILAGSPVRSGYDRVPVDPQRGRVFAVSACSASASAASSRPTCSRSAICFRRARLPGGCQQSCCSVGREWRLEAGLPRVLDRVGFYAAAFAIGILFNVAHLMVIGTLVWRRAQLWHPERISSLRGTRPEPLNSDRASPCARRS